MTSNLNSTRFIYAAIAASAFGAAGYGQAGQLVSSQVKVVANLYRAFAYESVVEEPDAAVGFLDSAASVQGKYLTPRLMALIRKDRKCTITTHEICKLDWLPLWDSQDPIGATVKVKATSDTNKVNAEVRYQQEVKTLTYTLQRLDVGWRIDDISYGNTRPTLRETLSAPN
jgi:hypothetical protein